MRVLSLFDGISCGQVALNRAGINYDTYYASEIDKFAKQVTQQNYPRTFQLGDINNWKNWGFDFGSIDLIFAGFPCQAWSVAGKQKGDNDPRGALVHTLIDIWKEVKKKNPNVKFLFENVRMKKDFIVYINELFNVEPIEINSALVSAQNRKRLYWTNIPNVTQPKDKGIVLKEVISWSRSTRYPKDGPKYVEFRFNKNGKSNTLTTGWGCGSFSSKNLIFLHGLEEGRRLDDGKSFSRNFREGARIYSIDGKSATLTAKTKGGKGGYSGLYGEAKKGKIIARQLTPNECEKLQTLPENYTEQLSDTQRYKAIGNGWTVDVIVHILKCGVKNNV